MIFLRHDRILFDLPIFSLKSQKKYTLKDGCWCVKGYGEFWWLFCLGRKMNTLGEKFAWGNWRVGETMHYYIDYKCKEENDSQPGLFADSLGSSNYDQCKLPSKTS